MSEREQNQASGERGRVLRHDEWEALLADALDGTLSAADAAAFSRHQNECAACGQILKETQQGKSWMEYLAAEPEVPAGLLQKILTRTSGQPQVGDPGVAASPILLPARPAWRHVLLPAVRHATRHLHVTGHLMNPRLMMTAAMAFFSIALTLNLAGIKLTQLRTSDFQPSRLRANLTRQYYSTNEQVTKYYENLRLVYEMEARVRELKRSAEPESTPQPTQRPPVRDGSGSPSSTVPRGQQNPPSAGKHTQRDVVLPAVVVPAGFEGGGKKRRLEVFRALHPTTEDQAQRSLV
jgi:hypothetical protein